MASYRDLDVWNISTERALIVYSETQAWPKHELYGMSGQIRRAAVSVSCNIAEGHARGYRKDYLHFLSTAIGSLREVETLVHIASKLNYLQEESQIQPLCDRVALMLIRLRASLQKPAAKAPQS